MANSSILVLAITVILCLSQEALLVASSEQFSEIIYEKSNKITKVGENWDTRGYMRNRRESEHMIAKRQTGHDLPDSSLQDYIVDYHNRLRRQEGASNMQHMRWNQHLAIMAAMWAEECIWEHGQPDYEDAPYKSLGQNLYMTTSQSATYQRYINKSMIGWYDSEKPHYDYDTRKCASGEQCGHYTQVVWHSSEEVGCARAFCEDVRSSSFEDATMVVCNYGPPGNYKGAYPYLKGDACTECNSGKNWCDDGLCRDRDGCPHCECKASCLNCGTVTDECSCSCAKGFIGPRCGDPCQDNHKNCGASPGWPKRWCDEEHDYVLEKCPLLCSLCEEADGPPGTCEEPTPKPTTPKPTTPKPTTPKPTTPPPTTPKPTTPKPTTPKPTTPKPTTPKPTTPNPTTTTTAVPTTATTVATTTQVDCTGYCKNEGVTSIVNNECRCRCSEDYQGERCRESKEEARVGAIITLFASIDRWDNIWKVFIRPFLVDIVNSWCNDHAMVCCVGASISETNDDLYFTTEDHVKVGQGYPQEAIRRGRAMTISLVFIYGAPNNDLCANTINSVNRRKRDLPDFTLPQESLVEIMQGVESELNETLYDCCGITVAGIEAAQEDIEPTTMMPDDDDKNGPLGLDLWIWVVIGIGGCTIVLATCCIVICCYCIRKNKPDSKSKKYEATNSAPVNGHDNKTYDKY